MKPLYGSIISFWMNGDQNYMFEAVLMTAKNKSSLGFTFFLLFAASSCAPSVFLFVVLFYGSVFVSKLSNNTSS